MYHAHVPVKVGYWEDMVCYSEEFNNAVRRTKLYGLSTSGCDGLFEGETLFYDVSILNALMKMAYKKDMGN